MMKSEARNPKYETNFFSKFEIRNSKFKALPGYTFIEMLISIAILSGLLIIVLGVVASSSGSSARVSILREKNQAARALIDQISSDWRFVDSSAVFEDVKVPGHACVASVNAGNCYYNGYSIDTTRLVMALNLTGQTPASKLVRKEYNIATSNNHQTLSLIETRECQLVSSQWQCGAGQQSEKTDLLSTAYTLSTGSVKWSSSFGGWTVTDGDQASPKFTPYLTVSFALKPAEFNSLTCDELDPGSCYKVSTTLSLGSRG